jgi:RNA methyltransferase, TrmH family
VTRLDRTDEQTIAAFRSARRDDALVVLEGFHALKHALRFGASVLTVCATDPAKLEELAAVLAPDLEGRFQASADVVPSDVFRRLAPQAPRTGVIAIATRPSFDVPALLAKPRPAPIVLLEDPRNLQNMGACIRVAAAADAAAVFTTGRFDPWCPDAVRGAAGLHFAVPVANIARIPLSDRPVVAIDPDGKPLEANAIPPRAILAFGAERYGLSDELRRRADMAISIPMRSGVSSLNLATSVAVVLYSQLF